MSPLTIRLSDQVIKEISVQKKRLNIFMASKKVREQTMEINSEFAQFEDDVKF